LTAFLAHALAGCSSAVPRVAPPAQERGDSLVLERVNCYWGTCPAYRLRLTRDGHVHYESRNARDNGRTAEMRVESAAVAALFDTAASLGLDALPEDLMGKAPYCGIVATDHAAVIITWHRAEGAQRVRDYLGCLERYDESSQEIIRRLRAFEQAVDSVSRVAASTSPIPRRQARLRSQSTTKVP
jgi:hypothetical protein